MFADEGLGAPMREVARRTDVGPATLHRHFPTKRDLILAAFPDARDFAADREQTLRAVAELSRRARQTGHPRPDFVVDDLVLMPTAHRGIHTAPPATRLTASRRFAAYMIDAFRPPARAAIVTERDWIVTAVRTA